MSFIELQLLGFVFYSALALCLRRQRMA